ncbi:ovochymase-2-like isoform X2 [Stegastes partitus]|uniref:Ovochymase-2-like isoform X2 n=1 Tax=Stegastes partitus TaxID=144197 RepID=A0A9Y4NTX7_9TELE|nr:PREDICTED: ovochymase-2-like isoform X2 [Stegastes partitus]
MRHRAVRGHSDPGCGTVVLVEDPAAVHSPNYPQSYGDDCVLRWVVYAPHGHVVKLDFADFDLEESDRCLYDSLTVFGDVAGTEEIAVLCGRGPPPPVLSYHSVMVLQFTSDSSVAHGGFSASLTFISDADLHDRDGPDVEQHPDVFTANRRHTAPHVVQPSSSRSLQAAVDPGRHVVGGSGDGDEDDDDDDDDDGESSGTTQ